MVENGSSIYGSNLLFTYTGNLKGYIRSGGGINLI